jgi:biopolymer transport protein ExbD
MSDAHVGRRTRKIPYKKQGHGPSASAPNSNINVTPLVDVCLVLLIIFMVVTPMLGRGKDVQLPELVEADEHKEGDQVFVSVDDQGVWINQDGYTTRGDFVDALREELKTAAGKAAAQGYEGPLMFIKGDNATNFGRVKTVMLWISEAEIQDIALVVDTNPMD